MIVAPHRRQSAWWIGHVGSHRSRHLQSVWLRRTQLGWIVRGSCGLQASCRPVLPGRWFPAFFRGKPGSDGNPGDHPHPRSRLARTGSSACGQAIPGSIGEWNALGGEAGNGDVSDCVHGVRADRRRSCMSASHPRTGRKRRRCSPQVQFPWASVLASASPSSPEATVPPIVAQTLVLRSQGGQQCSECRIDGTLFWCSKTVLWWSCDGEAP